MKPYSKYSRKKLIVSEKICSEILSIPIYPELTDKSQNNIIQALNNFKG